MSAQQPKCERCKSNQLERAYDRFCRACARIEAARQRIRLAPGETR